MQHSLFYTWTNRIITLTANHESKTKSNGNTNRYYSQTTALEVQWWWTSPMPIHRTPYPICFHALLFQRRPMWDVDRHGRGCSVEERASDREQWYCLILPRHPSQVQRWRVTTVLTFCRVPMVDKHLGYLPTSRLVLGQCSKCGRVRRMLQSFAARTIQTLASPQANDACPGSWGD